MLPSIVAIFIAVIAIGVFALIGRVALIRQIRNNERLANTVTEFHKELVTYARSRGEDQVAFQRLAMRSPAVERVLGWDNYVNGVVIGSYMLNNAPLLPLAIQELRREFSDGLSWKDDAGAIADAIQTLLYRHVGRRQSQAEHLMTRSANFWSCVAAGWQVVAALPISVLAAFGILTEGGAVVARQSLSFRLWSLISFILTLLGVLFAYIPQQKAIDAAFLAWF